MLEGWQKRLVELCLRPNRSAATKEAAPCVIIRRDRGQSQDHEMKSEKVERRRENWAGWASGGGFLCCWAKFVLDGRVWVDGRAKGLGVQRHHGIWCGIESIDVVDWHSGSKKRGKGTFFRRGAREGLLGVVLSVVWIAWSWRDG